MAKTRLFTYNSGAPILGASLSSSKGKLYFVTDGTIIISGGEARERYPSFTMINILFKKN